ncbi:hypothetical protein TUSST3_63500 [Streptomyces sp. TUS-ST3]|nr:hypothetical protein TUSST3_63500 [Streptomyces sp. TUS-ST3]
MLPLQCGELVLGGRPVREGGSGRHGRMAPQRAVGGQATHKDVRRTVDRVDERFDERSLPRRLPAPFRAPFRSGRVKKAAGPFADTDKLIPIRQ